MPDIETLTLALGISIPTVIDLIAVGTLLVRMWLNKKRDEKRIQQIFEKAMEEVKKESTKIAYVGKDLNEMKTQISQINIQLNQKRKK